MKEEKNSCNYWHQHFCAFALQKGATVSRIRQTESETLAMCRLLIPVLAALCVALGEGGSDVTGLALLSADKRAECEVGVYLDG